MSLYALALAAGLVKNLQLWYSNSMVQSSWKRALFVGLVVFFVFAAVFGGVYVFDHHDCIGETCHVCLRIETIQTLLKGFVLVGLAGFFSPSEAPVKAFKVSFYPLRLLPVSLKVRFNA
jgi:hypothetical protein